LRLWHQKLIKIIDNQRLLGQHRECCALRGKGWGKKHSTVDYIFDYPFEYLVAYHLKVIWEMWDRDYNPNINWLGHKYRGKSCKPKEQIKNKIIEMELNCHPIYPEHDKKYLAECINNLLEKGAVCKYLDEIV
jgi:uncharacterized protein (TIGR02328 family)